MTQRFLRNVADGTIYDWNPILAANPKCVEVTEEEAYPERFLKKEMVVKAKRTQRRTKKKLDLTTDDLFDLPTSVAPEIEADASRGLPE